MAASPSSIASSMFTSRTLAPLSTCSRATLDGLFVLAAAGSAGRTSCEPVTLVRSPIIMKLLSGRSTSGSRPLKRVSGSMRGRCARRLVAHGLGDRADVRRRGAAAAADDVQPAVGGELAQHARPSARAFRRTRQTRWASRRWDSSSDRSGASADSSSMYGPHLLRAEGAVDAHAQQVGVRDRVPEGLDRLADHRAAAVLAVGDRDRGHHRQADLLVVEVLLDGEQAGLEVQRVEARSPAAGYRRPLPPARRPARSRIRPARRT